MTQLTVKTNTRHFTAVMDENRQDVDLGNGSMHRGNTLRLILADGGSMSVQASEYHYCSPRINLDSYAGYNSFEIGFPNKHYPELDKYQDYSPSGDPTDSVYAYVPLEVVEQLINSAGGVTGVLMT